MCEIEGVKFDTEKMKWNLVVWEFFEAVVRVLMFGAKKYAPENWKHVDGRRERYQNALIRHVVAYVKGEAVDRETGESHLACAGCNLMFLFWMDMTDDNYDTTSR